MVRWAILALGRKAEIFCRVNDLIANNIAGNNDFGTATLFGCACCQPLDLPPHARGDHVIYVDSRTNQMSRTNSSVQGMVKLSGQ